MATNDIIGGAASGAASGAAGGPTGIAVGAGIGGLAGALLGSRKQATGPDLTPVYNALNAGKTEQNATTNALPGKLAPLSSQYQSNIEGALANAQKTLGSTNQAYVSGVGDTSNAMFTNQANLLKQQTLDASQAAGRQMRGNLAAGGNLNSGAGVASANKLATNTANQISQGVSGLATQSLAAKQQALSDTYKQNAGLVENTLGINQSMFNTLLASGREDLIDQANQLIQESQNYTGQMASATMGGATMNNAANLGNQAAGADLENSVLKALGTGMGNYFGSRKPATTVS